MIRLQFQFTQVVPGVVSATDKQFNIEILKYHYTKDNNLIFSAHINEERKS